MPDIADTNASLLVVDGFINGNGVTRIRLSRTENVAATGSPPAEKGARLFIFDEQGARYPLTERSAGLYQSDSLVLPANRRYQLRITTAGTRAANYESDLVPLKVTPPLDRVGWRLADEQVQLLVTTHDATGQSRYYRWGYTETWQFNAAFESALEYSSVYDDIRSRTTPIYTCWQTVRSSRVQQSTTTQFSQDAVTDWQLLAFSARAERLKIRYSVLVSQVVETADEYAYYELLRKNTEAVGTVNDPLPVQLTGNVHRVGNAEPVLGYVGAHTVQYQRLFINRADLPLPGDWVFDSPYRACAIDSMGEEVFKTPAFVPIGHDSKTGTYYGSSSECVDCRTRGSNVKPSFW
ncbi:DUF4249 domain-containing protein [Hymenobacter sp. RP-2-7]|uniref:DUF4249 domain-containing protein n=1 Tax=Hymenobacter polaris TaxID=2682546 RepID=A0A7Y0AEY9_9BACT|nr:DUF4249 domain-containing protein [Hymenobacter polaris]NML66084.1 DUF4249 domain-containing protein [Hymenobacter polaris]